MLVNSSRPIHRLPEDVALKIAAGEVITRPADAVKELVENAIDACLAAGAPPNGGPHRVEVEIRGGGLGLIRVVDSGCGIPADSLPLAFERHATSKLATAEDLFAVRTLGFRGEALASIAAIAQVVTYTRTADADLGRLLTIEHGRVTESEPRGGPVGTSLTVRNLFQNVPARLRFLRTATGEASQIAHVVGLYALAYPEIHFTLLNDGRVSFQSPGTGRLADALPKYLDATLAARLLPVDDQAGRVRVSGFVGDPGATRGTRSGIALFVNRRWIQSRSLTFAVEEAYQPSLPGGRHPIAVLHIELPTDEVDVNVHPTKAEVRFVDERAIYTTVRRAVRTVVLRAAPVPDVGALAAVGDLSADWLPADGLSTDFGSGLNGGANSRLASSGSERQGFGGASGSTDAPAWYAAAAHRQGALDLPPMASSPAEQPASSFNPGQPAATRESVPPFNSLPESVDSQFAASPRPGLPILHPIGQVQRTYIVAEGPDGVYFVDQHTAHERIRYEEIRERRNGGAVASQTLLQPLVVDLTPRQWELLGEGAPRLRALGFDCEPFGERTALLRSAPAMLRDEGIAQAFAEIVDALANEEPTLPEGIDAPSALLACHSAVRAGDALSDVEMRELLRRLEGLDIWRYCPHGRPIMIRLDAARLAKDFGR